jgi:hypothetical protein
MSWGLVAGAVIGGVASNVASNRATGASKSAAAQSDALEREKFAEAKRQADILRQRGDEAAAVAMEEAARADLGAEKFQALSNQYAQQFQTYANQADKAAAEREALARRAYVNVGKAADAKQAAGQDSKQAILDSARGVNDAAAGVDARLSAANAQSQGMLTDAFGNISARFSPFVQSEQRARGQMDVELGLAEGDPNKGYRNTSAYMAAQDASRVAQEEAVAGIDQAAGNSGTLYSGTRGAALVDRASRGSYERAGIEQSYYQNYMNMLKSMADPVSTNLVSGYESDIAKSRAAMNMNTASQIGSTYFDAAGTGLNASMAAEQVGLNSMRTGEEGLGLMAYLDPGNAGAQSLAAAGGYELGGFNDGTAGSPYRLGAQDYLIQGAGGAANATLGNMPTGTAGSNYRLAGVEAGNAALSDFAGGVNTLANAYMMYGPNSSNQNYSNPNSPSMVPNAYLPSSNYRLS